MLLRVFLEKDRNLTLLNANLHNIPVSEIIECAWQRDCGRWPGGRWDAGSADYHNLPREAVWHRAVPGYEPFRPAKWHWTVWISREPDYSWWSYFGPSQYFSFSPQREHLAVRPAGEEATGLGIGL